MPAALAAALLPFQREGVRFGLRRGGRVLIADEMGVGKTVQAVALASCYRVRRGHLWNHDTAVSDFTGIPRCLRADACLIFHLLEANCDIQILWAKFCRQQSWAA